MSMVERIRARIGDFWWSAALMFVALRFGDGVNAFIGLWLVPRHVPASELGAVLPLGQAAAFLSFPVAVFAAAFSREVNLLAAAGERGKLKTLLGSVFVCVALGSAAVLAASRLALPLLFERVRMAEGSLGYLVVAAALLGSVAPVYVNALQALKRFGAVSAINAIASPFRLVTMLVAMPFRAVSGYFAGQSAQPLWQIAASWVALRGELGAGVKREPYWTRQRVRSLLGYIFLAGLYMGSCALIAFVQPLVIRQRLSETDSGAFYMISRFAEIATYASAPIVAVLFPHASETAAAGRSILRLAFRSFLVSAAFGAIVAIALFVFGRPLLALLPGGQAYAPYAGRMAILAIVFAIGAAVNCPLAAAAAAADFRFLFWYLPVHLIYAAAMMFISGYGYFASALPAAVGEAVARVNALGLDWVLGSMAVFEGVKLLCLFAFRPREAAP